MPHCLQTNGISPVWALECNWSTSARQKGFSLYWHWKGFTLVCLLLCLWRTSERLKDLSHKSHGKRLFTGVYSCMLLEISGLTKHLPHWWRPYGLSRMCSVRWPKRAFCDVPLQILGMPKSFSSVVTFQGPPSCSWFFRYSRRLKQLSRPLLNPIP